MDQLFLQAEKNINASINPLKLQIWSELKNTLEWKSKWLIIDSKEITNWVKACMIDPQIKEYICDWLPVRTFPISKIDEVLIPKLKNTSALQHWVKEKSEERSYAPNQKHLNNPYRKKEQQQLESLTKTRNLQTIVVNKISELAFADLLDDIIQDMLKNKKVFPTILSAHVYKTNTFDDTKRKSDFMIFIEHKSGKKSCLSIDLTTSKDEYILAKKDAFDIVSQTDFQSFLVDKYKHTFWNDKDIFNKKVAQYQTAKINRTILPIDKNILTYFLRDYIAFIGKNKGTTKHWDALKVFKNLTDTMKSSDMIDLVHNITEYLSTPSIIN